MSDRATLVETYMDRAAARNPGEEEFLQALQEVVRDTITIEKADARLAAARVLDRLAEPDRIIRFRVVWQDDEGRARINSGWRVQYCNAMGPYKGGLRFHPGVTASVLKFLAFEQTFKNALTGLPLGGAKGGADFDPRGRSEAEIMRFCQALMRELGRYIGPDRDVPAGDVNVGTREIGWLFGAYKQLQGDWHGALTGKGRSFGGSALRTEATGYGLVHFVHCMAAEQGGRLEGRRVAVSGKGNVATHAAEKAAADGARVVSLSDTAGTLLSEEGMGAEAIDWVRARKAAGEKVADPPAGLGLRFLPGQTPWAQPCDIALPCATQNELGEADARALAANGCRIVAEGANMPVTPAAARVLRDAGIAHAPGKAANAGGVAISGLEMSQNAHGAYRDRDGVHADLRRIMADIHRLCVAEGRDGDRIDYGRGANIAAFRRVADAVAAMGTI